MTPSFTPMPKVELHSHIDCSLSHETVARIGLDLTPEEYLRDFVAPERCRDLAEYLACIGPALNILQTRSALRFAVEGMVAAQAAETVLYAEMRFAPHLHVSEGLDLHTIVETVLDAMQKASRKHGVHCGLILCTLRHFSEAQGLEVAALARRYQSQGVVALDLAGDEANFPIGPHVAAFRAAAEAGVNRIAHAGEAKGAESVTETLDKLEVQRIGHGVRSIEDPRVVERLVREGVALEVCPSCNVQIGIFPSLRQHSLGPLRDAGVNLSINTDARATTDVSLSEEYSRVSAAFSWSPEDMMDLTMSALDASFAPDAVRASLKVRIEEFRRGLQPG